MSHYTVTSAAKQLDEIVLSGAGISTAAMMLIANRYFGFDTRLSLQLGFASFLAGYLGTHAAGWFHAMSMNSIKTPLAALQ